MAFLYTVLMFFLSFRGKFAVVRKCVEKCTGHEYAAKFMRKRRKGQDCRMEIIHEIAVLELATASPRVVNLHQVYEMASEMVLVLELWVSKLHTTPKHSTKAINMNICRWGVRYQELKENMEARNVRRTIMNINGRLCRVRSMWTWCSLLLLAMTLWYGGRLVWFYSRHSV